MVDSWKIKELFKFDEKPLKIFNDTQKEVLYRDHEGKEFKINTDFHKLKYL